MKTLDKNVNLWTEKAKILDYFLFRRTLTTLRGLTGIAPFLGPNFGVTERTALVTWQRGGHGDFHAADLRIFNWAALLWTRFSFVPTTSQGSAPPHRAHPNQKPTPAPNKPRRRPR